MTVLESTRFRFRPFCDIRRSELDALQRTLNSRHELRAKGREAAFGTSGRWGIRRHDKLGFEGGRETLHGWTESSCKAPAAGLSSSSLRN